jgi:hypothetical protein
MIRCDEGCILWKIYLVVGNPHEIIRLAKELLCGEDDLLTA